MGLQGHVINLSGLDNKMNNKNKMNSLSNKHINILIIKHFL